MLRDGDPAEADRLASAGLELLPESEIDARTDALRRLAAAAWWPGDLRTAERHTRSGDLAGRGVRAARPVGARHGDACSGCSRCSSTSTAPKLHSRPLERTEEGVDRPGAGALRDRVAPPDAGSPRRGARGTRRGAQAVPRRRSGRRRRVGGPHHRLDRRRRGRPGAAARAFREAIRVFATIEDHGHLCEAQRALAEVLLVGGQRRRGRAPRARPRPRSSARTI